MGFQKAKEKAAAEKAEDEARVDAETRGATETGDVETAPTELEALRKRQEEITNIPAAEMTTELVEEYQTNQEVLSELETAERKAGAEKLGLSTLFAPLKEKLINRRKQPKVVTEKETTDVETGTEVEAEPEDRLKTIAKAADTVKEETQEQIEAISQVEEQAIDDAEKLLRKKGFSSRKAEDFTDEEISTFAMAIPALERSKMSTKEKTEYFERISIDYQTDFIAKEGREPTNEERNEIFNRVKKK